MVQRLHAHPYLSLFNGADPSLSTPIRDSSTVSMQALYLLNSAFVHQKANGFANSLLNASNVSQDRIESAYLRVFGRRPTDDEVAKCTAFIDRYVQSLEAEGVPIDRREVEAWSSLVRALFAANEFFYVD